MQPDGGWASTLAPREGLQRLVRGPSTNVTLDLPCLFAPASVTRFHLDFPDPGGPHRSGDWPIALRELTDASGRSVR